MSYRTDAYLYLFHRLKGETLLLQYLLLLYQGFASVKLVSSSTSMSSVTLTSEVEGR